MEQRLRELREHMKLSRQAFGQKLGVSGDVINNLERGRAEIKDSMINLIVRTYKVNETWLRTGEGEMFTQLDPEDELMEWVGKLMAAQPEDFRRRFVKMLSQLTDEQWKTLEEKCLEVAGMEDEEG